MPSLRLLSVEAPGARAQRGSWASCAPQPLASGPKHGQGCSQAGRRRQVGVRWRFGLVRARWRPECPHFGFCRWRRAGHLCDLPALGGPGQGQGYAGARVRVTFSRIGTAARSLDPVLLHPGFWERGSILQKKRHTFFLLVSVGLQNFGSLRKETTRLQMMVREFHGRE